MPGGGGSRKARQAGMRCLPPQAAPSLDRFPDHVGRAGHDVIMQLKERDHLGLTEGKN